jgi:heat shock protein HslJ
VDFDAVTSNPESIAGVNWLLLRHKEREQDVDVSSLGASLYLGADASITWSAGNTSRGSVLIEGDRLRVSYVASTAAMIRGHLGDLDRLMGGVLTSSPRWSLDSDELSLADDHGRELIFRRSLLPAE